MADMARLAVAGEAEILAMRCSDEVRKRGVGRSLMDAVLRYLYQERARYAVSGELMKTMSRHSHCIDIWVSSKVGDRPACYGNSQWRSVNFICDAIW